MPHIASIVYSPKIDYEEPADRYLRVPVSMADLVAGHGIDGDRKGSNPERGLNVMSAEILAQLAQEGFQTGPGQMGEQIVISGLDFDSLADGVQLQLGQTATIAFLKNRTGCERFEHIQGQPREIVAGRVGFMASVVTGGRIKVGDPVRVLEAVPGD
jgi:MOSC domain-containing protein YiiM